MTAAKSSPKTAKVQEADREWEIEAHRNGDWIEAHREELSQYDGQWIAVAEQRLIAHDPDPETVARQARERGFTQALCYFITSEIMAFA